MPDTTLQFYLARAEPARVEAETETLSHVRERFIRCAAAWTGLAERAARVQWLRIDEQHRKAAVPPK